MCLFTHLVFFPPHTQVTGNTRVSRLPIGRTELVFLRQEPHFYLGGLQPDSGGPQCTGECHFRHLQGGRDGHLEGVALMGKRKRKGNLKVYFSAVAFLTVSGLRR